jgi:DNA mismatch repair protein MutS
MTVHANPPAPSEANAQPVSGREADQRATPMMAQYFEIKAANPDCLLFYRMGDFYELFFADAEIASRALGIVLTKRGKHDGADIPMCGVPIERADEYLQRLIALGHRVAVCEQLEDPALAKKRGPKSVVRRNVVRLVTPGTITEERLLEPGRANLLVAIHRVRSGEERTLFGVAAVDISTGAFWLSESEASSLGAEVSRLEPSEIILGEATLEDADAKRALGETRAAVTPIGREAMSGESAERVLREFYRVDAVDGLGAFTRAEIGAAALVLQYVARTQLAARPALNFPTRRPRTDAMEIDAATRTNLELTRALDGGRKGSLLATIDWTKTPAGARLLAERLAGPLTDPDAINRRLDAISCLVGAERLRADLRDRLAGAPDFGRSLSRLSLDRAGPRDLAALRDGLGVARRLAATLAAQPIASAALAEATAALNSMSPALEKELAAVLADNLPLNKRDGGFVRAGVDPTLDEARALRDESRRVIADLQGKYAALAETNQLRIKHNHFLGFFIETPQAQGERLLRAPYAETFIHRQTMAGAMRFSTNELAELEAKIASAADRALALELEAFERLRQTALAELETIRKLGVALAEIDVSAALAELAAVCDWTRPIVDDSLAFAIEAGRHPVVEAALRVEGEPFVANDCDLTGDIAEGGRLALVTGPNMAGKSTYLRQAALVALLAQMGGYVPARRAHLGIVDRLFSRVGAADDLARGRSTFMVEMVETAAILNQATRRSLVILDEIGRGTATFDGLSIAFATIEHLNAVNRSRALFATHFHELTRLAASLPRMINLALRVTEWKGELVFLHEVAPGAADRSYGVQVAKLAGLPTSVVERARAILAELEAENHAGAALAKLDDLPLFTYAPTASAAPKADVLRQRLAALDPDDLSPREAQAALYGLKQLAKES